MPHCDTCLHFYPASMPSGCPICDTRGFHKRPYCVWCGTPSTTPVKEVDTDGMTPLRPGCPGCGRGPMIPSSGELKRRMQLNPAVEPFIPTPEEVKVLNEAGDLDLLKLDGDLLGVVKLRRTHGPIELFVQAPTIERYFKEIFTNFLGGLKPGTYTNVSPDGLPIYGSPAGPANPYHGKAYYPVSNFFPTLQFYNPEGTRVFGLKGYGADANLPGIAGLKGHAVDLSFLLTAGLTDGITFKYPTVVDDYSIGECLRSIKSGLTGLYTHLMKPVNHEVVIAVRSVGPAQLPLGGPTAVPKLKAEPRF